MFEDQGLDLVRCTLLDVRDQRCQQIYNGLRIGDRVVSDALMFDREVQKSNEP